MAISNEKKTQFISNFPFSASLNVTYKTTLLPLYLQKQHIVAYRLGI